MPQCDCVWCEEVFISFEVTVYDLFHGNIDKPSAFSIRKETLNSYSFSDVSFCYYTLFLKRAEWRLGLLGKKACLPLLPAATTLYPYSSVKVSHWLAPPAWNTVQSILCSTPFRYSLGSEQLTGWQLELKETCNIKLTRSEFLFLFVIGLTVKTMEK